MRVADILQAARRGCLLSTGVQVAIVGRPNVGKSSLLNAWSRSERAIVTAIPGTTRDIVEASVSVFGVPVSLLDTAGIRDGTADAVESIGMERSRTAAAGADVVLMVIDAEAGWTHEDELVHSSLPVAALPRPALLAVNKSDRLADASAVAGLDARVRSRFRGVVFTSAALGQGIDRLELLLANTLGVGGAPVEGTAWAANQRQAEALEQALEALRRLELAIRDALPIDCWTVELREAALALGLIDGADVTEEVLDTIFSRFCIGK